MAVIEELTITIKKIWMLSLKKDIPSYNYYNNFIIIGDTIPDVLESLYQYINHRNEETDMIPFYLRSTNLRIINIGEVNLNKDNLHFFKNYPILNYTYCN